MNKITRGLIVITLCICSLTAFSQTKSYKKMMYDNTINFYEVVDSAEAYFATHDKGKGSGFKGYQRWKNENESKYFPSGDRYNVDHYMAQNAFQKFMAQENNKSKTSFPNGWIDLGPWDANNVTSHYSPGIGRVETFWVDPNNTNRIFLGSRSGGFWRTLDGGSTWENTTDFLVASGVRSIAVNPQNSNEVLIAVQHGGAGYTHGIYRSTTGGSTWTKSNFNPDVLFWGGLGDNERIYKIAYHPTIPNMVYVGCTKGFYYSEDNLQTFTQVGTGNYRDIEFHPTKPSHVYAYSLNTQDNIKLSVDSGKTFINSGLITPNTSNGYIAVTPHQPDFLYFASTSGIWKSEDEGASFTFLSNPDESGLGFAVSDLDTSNMIYGYVDTEASTDGGYTFTEVTKWSVQNDAYVHADIRTIECLNGVFYMGTDGYLVKSENNGTTWTILNDGCGIREFYAVGLSQGNNTVQMAGSQDNGTSILSEGEWIEWNGGDGMEALVHPLNDDWMLGSWQYGTRNITTNGGLTRNGTGNPEGGSNNAAWEAPFLMNPLNSMRVYHMSDSIYSGDNFGRNWTLFGAPGIGVLLDAAISEQDSNVMAVARQSTLRLTADGGQTWINIKNNLPNYSVTDIAFDPKNDSTIVVTYNRYQNDGRKVYISQDRGNSWTNITYNLGDMPLRTVVVDHTDSSNIYVGGEIGVYYKSLNATTWTLYNNQLPNVTVKDLEIHYGSNTLRAATWGRGLWEYTLVGRNDYPSITRTSISHPPTESTPKLSVSQYVEATIESDNSITSAQVRYGLNDPSMPNGISMANAGGDNWKSSTPLPEGQIGDRVYFMVMATDNLGNISETYRFNYSIKPFKYCDAGGASNTTVDWINRVSLNGMVNLSGKDSFGDFTDTIVNLQQGENYTLEIGMNTVFDLDTCGAWIDFDRDTEFEESERIVMSSFTNNTATGSFTVPVDAEINAATRMRVRSQYWAEDPTPCGIRTGEVEDYSIIIQAASNTDVRKTGVVNIIPNPSKGIFQVHLPNHVSMAKVMIYDIKGRLIFTQDVDGNNSAEISAELATGIYTVKVESGDGFYTGKLIVE